MRNTDLMCRDKGFRQSFCICRNLFEKLFIFHRHISKKCHYDSERERILFSRKGGMDGMQNTTELIGILQAISIVAKSLAMKLMQIEKDLTEYESGAVAADRRKMKKGWR